ncbi:hypothetical protein [uncultured Gammaproteobacteria bacterium]|nr:hypothetical protein [uncultured Gammaproteobacteria bacterium]CAC9969896.1 hypothetical protein [uncultured Gammaproteobacteria bacterium]
MYILDASALIDLWDNYPITNPVFKSLWGKFKENIDEEIFVISSVALDEAKKKIDQIEFTQIVENITVYKKEAVDLEEAITIKNLLDIQEEGYGSGVGENDIFIIVIAKRTNSILITNEKRQPSLKQQKRSYKMPTVCNLSEVGVRNINLLELLRLDLW